MPSAAVPGEEVVEAVEAAPGMEAQWAGDYPLEEGFAAGARGVRRVAASAENLLIRPRHPCWMLIIGNCGTCSYPSNKHG